MMFKVFITQVWINSFVRALRICVAIFSIVIIASGCSSHSPSVADRQFVSQMIPHHHLGVELIDEATLHSSDVQLRRLVFEMGTYHHDELAILMKWKSQWKVGESTQFPGDVPAGDIESLSKLTGLSHDTWWLHLMIKHHEGALVIAGRAIPSATEPDVVTMARSVMAIQRQQITKMKELLASLCASQSTLSGC